MVFPGAVEFRIAPTSGEVFGKSHDVSGAHASVIVVAVLGYGWPVQLCVRKRGRLEREGQWNGLETG